MSPKRFVCFALALGVASVASGDPTPASPSGPAKPKEGLEWNLNFLPIAFQRRPKLDMTYFTELTDAGRAITPPTQERPAFYVIKPSGAHTFGDGNYRTPPPTESDLRGVTRHSLEEAHYLEAGESTPPPTLAIFYHWGVHAGIDPLIGETNLSLVLRNLRERAVLVGGRAFADRWLKAINDDLVSSEAGFTLPQFASAQGRLESSSTTMRRLMAQAREDIYFVIMTAYDAAALARNERVVLWRTTMTVDTQGVAMRETIAPLIAASVPYLGREMTEALPVRRRIYRDGRVEYGTPEVISYEFPTEDAQADPAPPEPTTPPPPAEAVPAK